MSKKLSDPTIPELSDIADNARIYVLLMDEPEGSRDRYINLSVVAASSNGPSGNASGNVTSHGGTTVNVLTVYASTDGTKIKSTGIDYNDLVLTADLADYVTDAELSAELADYVTTTDLDDYITSSELTTALGPYATISFALGYANSAANIANSVAVSIGAAANGWTNASVSGIDNTIQTINEQTVNNYTLVLTDKGKLVASNVIVSGANANVQIPNFGQVAFNNGTRIDVAKWGNVNTRITTANGVLLNGNYHATLEFSGQYVASGLHMQKANVWHAYGPTNRVAVSDIRQVNASNSQTGTVGVPTNVQFGDLILFYDFGANAASIPNNAAQTNFIPIVSRAYSTTSRLSLSMKIAEGNEGGTILNGFDADTTNRHIIVIFRGNVPFSNVYIGALNNVAATDADQGVQLANVVPPGIIFAAYRSSGAVSPRTFNLTSNGEHRASTSEYVVWHTANTATANASIDMDDEGNGNFLFSGSIICQ